MGKEFLCFLLVYLCVYTLAGSGDSIMDVAIIPRALPKDLNF